MVLLRNFSSLLRNLSVGEIIGQDGEKLGEGTVTLGQNGEIYGEGMMALAEGGEMYGQDRSIIGQGG